MKLMSNIITSPLGDGIYTVIFAILLIASVVGAVWYFATNIAKAKDECLYVKGIEPKSFIWIILLVGFLIRLIFGLIMKGYRGAMGTINYELNGYYEIYKAIEIIQDNGFGSLYNYSMNLFPVSAYIMSLFASIAKIFGAWGVNTAVTQFFMRLPLILCDVASAYLMYRIAKKYVNDYIGLTIAAVFMFCPVFMFGSAISVTPYPIMILGLVVTVYFLLSKNYAGLMLSFAITLLTMPDAVFLLPIVLIYIIYTFIKLINSNDKNKAQENKKTIISISCFAVLSIVLMYMLSLPFFIEDFGVNPFTIMYNLLLKPFGQAIYFSFNSLAIYNILGKNGARVKFNFPPEIFVIAFFIIAIVIVILVYGSKRNRANLVLLAAYLIVTFSIYMLGTSELTIMPAFVLLLLSFVLIRDKRILKVFAILSLIVFVNYMTVMIQSGFLSNVGSKAFASTAYNGDAVLLAKSSIGSIINIVCSICAAIAHVYFTMVILDITVTEKRKIITSGNNLKEVIAAWLSTK